MTKNNFESCIALTCTQKHQDKPATILRNIIQEPQKLFIFSLDFKSVCGHRKYH